MGAFEALVQDEIVESRGRHSHTAYSSGESRSHVGLMPSWTTWSTEQKLPARARRSQAELGCSARLGGLPLFAVRTSSYLV
jgi:hypothetical protein